MTALGPLALFVGEFEAGALALYYERAFAILGWRTTRYDVWSGYTRGGVLARARALRRLARPVLWLLMQREIIAVTRRLRPQLVVATKAPFLNRRAVQTLRRATDGPVVMVYPDNPYGSHTLRRNVLPVLGEFDRTYIWSRTLRRRLESDGVRSVAYLPFAFDPGDYRPDAPAVPTGCGRDHEVVFVGQHYDKREEWLSALEGCDVGLWGAGWERSRLGRRRGLCVHRESVRGVTVAGIYARALIGVNVLNSENVPGHNMRTFEIPPCRTAMLTEITEDIADFFSPGLACLTASSPQDFCEVVHHALADRIQLRAIADSGWRAAQPHTYVDRSRTLLEDLGMATVAQPWQV